MFKQKLEAAIQKNNSLLCVGLDTDIEKIPAHLKNETEPLFAFNKAIIDATANLVCSYKPNIAFYEAAGIEGLTQLKKTIEYIHKTYPEIPVILDAKRADIGNTSSMYAKEAFEILGADAITVNPYLGLDAIEPFLAYRDKGIIVLCRTSNPGAADFQELMINNEPLYMHIVKKVVEWNKTHGNCALVVGATAPEQLKKVRQVAPNLFFLVPGIGIQGGDIEKTLQAGLTKEKSGLILTSSRSILYASNTTDFAEKAREKAEEIRDIINSYRNV